ncbi:F-box/FBD/LRR-repeat protein At5g22660-like isoform X1 [Silene latifolia]|uniref:F-box/FBD/LRR-repeat protein At5g22660-like isoform X1 n=1 Tax=Silene latifolia TaxID=37657 RepID=UPI003D77AE9D
MPTVRRNSCEKIMGFEENVAKMERGTVDRISELPDFILHSILSMLDTKEVCRASVLSKKWYGAWSSVPVLDFQLRYFQKYGDSLCNCGDNTLERYLGFIDKTMQRYSMQKYRITKMHLMLPKIDEKLESLIDKWIMIAVQNQIQNFEIVCRGNYRLPEILFCAKSLKVLKCECVKLPYYETMELALEYLTLYLDIVDEDMLQRIISSSPLVELDITYDNCLVNISLPWMKKGNGGGKCRSSGSMQSYLQESPLKKFVYSGLGVDMLWSWNMNVVALKNLRKLEFEYASITDDIVSELACGLVALESLVLSECLNLKCIQISSNSLKQFRIGNAIHFIKVTIDAPKLLEFSYNTEIETSLSLVRVPDHCNAQFLPLELDPLTTVRLVKLKKFLVETNFFKSLVIELSNPLEIAVDEGQLRNAGTGLPYKLSELKLCGISALNLAEFSVTGFLDALFWCCHPDVLSITTSLQNSASEWILNILKSKVHCYKHPLRSIELEGADCSSLLSEESKPSKIMIRFRLSWFQV